MPQLRKRKTKELICEEAEKKKESKSINVSREVTKKKKTSDAPTQSKTKVHKSSAKRKKSDSPLCSDEESSDNIPKNKKHTTKNSSSVKKKSKPSKGNVSESGISVKTEPVSENHHSSNVLFNDAPGTIKDLDIKPAPSTVHNKQISKESSSSESEWEEVEDSCETASLDNYKPEIPEEGVEITIDCPDLRIKKRQKKKFDENEWIRLHINRVRKDNQLSVHKTHLLCLLAHGIYVNKILNSDTIKALTLSHIPDVIFSMTSGKKIDKINVSGLEKIVEWFRGTFDFQNDKCVFLKLFSSLVESFSTKSAMNASEYNLMFIAFARVLRFKVRLCMSLYPITYKASNLLKKPNGKKPKKSSSNEKEEKVIVKPETSSKEEKGEKVIDKPETSSKEEKVKVKKEPKRPKQSKSKPDKSSQSKKVIKDTVPRPRRSASKSYKLSSDEDDHLSDDDMSSDDDFKKLPKKTPQHKRKSQSEMSNRKVLSSDSEPSSPNHSAYNSQNVVCWAEVYLKSDKQWISVECVNNIINRPYDIEARAPKPVTYILAYDNDSYVKDVTRRYCNDYMTATIKLRVDPEWWEDSLEPFLPPNSVQDKAEEKKLDEMLVNKPLPHTLQGFKNHPLYALKRHLLKFEGIYPPDAPPVGFFRKEPVYARDCVHQLHSRETWLKEARVVRIGEEPYKIVKARPKWDRIAGVLRTDLPLEIFGHWQTEQYEPPIAVDGKVPRSEYGNVELFKPCMLPRGTVHLQLPGLNRIAKKLNIDCAAAVVGFDGHKGSVHPVFDGFVICEEFKDTIIAAWDEEQENIRKREEEKREKRIYGNWKKLIRGLLIRERIKLKYDTN